jgi:Tol biopolymer transport system component/DNA-binding winged helix-turn-helix (wHTH) protein
MATPTPTSRRLRFGPFELDAPAAQLRKNSTLIKLPPQPFRLLQLLAERAGTVVTREEIRTTLWTDSTFVDFEHGINFSINQIRAALADKAEKPRYIETLPRRGYRFIAAVEHLSGKTRLPIEIRSMDDSHPIDTATFQFPPIFVCPSASPITWPRTVPQPAIQDSHPRPKGKWLSLALVLGLGIVAGILVLYSVARPAARVVRVDQLTHSGRVDHWQRVVSDGLRIFFLEREGNQWQSKEIAATGGESQPLRSPFPNTKIFAISPDGSQFLVAPFTSMSGNLPLWIMPVVGGAPRRIGDLTANDATFSPNGTQIAIARDDGIFLTDLNGSNVRRIASLLGEPWYIAWSPDGQRLRFTVKRSSADASALWEVSADGKKLHPLFTPSSRLADQCCGRWTSDGAYFLFTTVENGSSDLWALKEPLFGFSWFRHQPVRLTSGPIPFADALPADHDRVVFAHGGSELVDILSVDPKTSEAKPLLPNLQAREAGFSPDGQLLYYVTAEALWRCRPDGSDRKQLAANSYQVGIYNPRWRADSKYLLYFEPTREGFNQIYVVSSDGGLRRAILQPDHVHDRPDWSPDGQSILFSIFDESRPGHPSENGIYLFDLQTGKTTSIPDSSDFYQARWSPDGRFLSAISSDSSSLQLFDFSRHRWSEIAHGSWISLPVWSPDAKFLYYQDLLKSGEPLFRYRPSDGSTEEVFNFESMLKTSFTRCLFIGLTPDGALLIRASGAGNLYKLHLELP